MSEDKNHIIEKTFIKHPVHFLALGFGAGCFPRAPGTAGTVVAVPIVYFMMYLPWQYYLLLTISCFILGIWICAATTKALGVHDHGAIVWDEIVGLMITMMMAPQGVLWLLIGFILFRIFDIWKPWPVRWLDHSFKGGLGIMIDDVFAALYALLLIQLSAKMLYS